MGKYQDQLTADMKVAMKAGEKFRLGVIRLLIADIKDRQMRSNQDTLDEEEELAVLRKAVKTRRDSVAQAEKANRSDIADAENAEIVIVQGYLPATLSGEDLLAKVKELAAEVGYEGPKDTGKFMKAWMGKHKGLAEGGDVNAALRSLN